MPKKHFNALAVCWVWCDSSGIDFQTSCFCCLAFVLVCHTHLLPVHSAYNKSNRGSGHSMCDNRPLPPDIVAIYCAHQDPMRNLADTYNRFHTGLNMDSNCCMQHIFLFLCATFEGQKACTAFQSGICVYSFISSTMVADALWFLNVANNHITMPCAYLTSQHRLLCTLQDCTLTTTPPNFFPARSPLKERVQLLNPPQAVTLPPRTLHISTRLRRASVLPSQRHLQQVLSCQSRPLQSPALSPRLPFPLGGLPQAFLCTINSRQD